jgi:hypothetical protein
MSEAIDSLTVYCRDNKRVCPLPKAWQQLWEMLPEKRRTVDAWEPAIPLIGAAWHDAPAMLKMVRLAEHLQWAAKHNALPEVAAFLRGLSGTTWANSPVTILRANLLDCEQAVADAKLGGLLRSSTVASATKEGYKAQARDRKMS